MATIVHGKKFLGALQGRPDLSSDCATLNTGSIPQVVVSIAENVPSSHVLEGDRLRATELNIIQISSRGYPVRPWSSGKQLPLGLKLGIWATSELSSLTGLKL